MTNAEAIARLIDLADKAAADKRWADAAALQRAAQEMRANEAAHADDDIDADSFAEVVR
ncbi:MAG: hypothetical protein ACYS26_19930 [Planctomycetota bacterium]|jgi:hypothetical protein